MPKKNPDQYSLGIPGHILVKELRSVYVKAPSPDGAQFNTPWLLHSAIKEAFDTDTDPQENLLTVLLDTRNRLIGIERTFRGTINSALVAPGDILRIAIVKAAASIVIAHNHPSGDPSPSTQDVTFTENLMSACNIIGIPLLDHIVLGTGWKFTSFRQEGISPFTSETA